MVWWRQERGEISLLRVTMPRRARMGGKKGDKNKKGRGGDGAKGDRAADAA